MSVIVIRSVKVTPEQNQDKIVDDCLIVVKEKSGIAKCLRVVQLNVEQVKGGTTTRRREHSMQKQAIESRLT